MKKICYLTAALLMASLLFAGCGKTGGAGSSSSGSSDYDGEAVIKAAVEVVSDLNDGKYDEITAKMDDTMLKALGENGLQTTWEPIKEKVGAFVEVEDSAFVEKDGYGIGAVLVKYENSELQVQVTFDKDMQISGLFFR